MFKAVNIFENLKLQSGEKEFLSLDCGRVEELRVSSRLWSQSFEPAID